MSEKTKNLGLFKYIPETDGKQVFSIVEALNNNWDILDEKGAGSGFNLFDTKLVDHVLEGKEAEGWALQGTWVNKNAVAGSSAGYPDFYNKCLEEYNESNLVNLHNNVIVNNVSIVDGVYSCYNRNYVCVNKQISFNAANSWEIVLDITTPSSYSKQALLGNVGSVNNQLFELRFADEAPGKLMLHLTSNGSSWDVINQLTGNKTFTINSHYFIKFSFTGTEYIVSYSEDQNLDENTQWVEDIKVSSTQTIYASTRNVCIGNHVFGADSQYPFSGKINLNNCYIKLNNDIVWRGATQILQHENGHKYYDYTNVDAREHVFEQKENAFGIDVINQRILLPHCQERIILDRKIPTSDDPNWYNLYSDGWLEQGGIYDHGSAVRSSTPNIRLQKSYTNTWYIVNYIPNRAGSTSDNVSMCIGLRTKEQDNFTCVAYGFGNTDASRYLEWTAYGYTNLEHVLQYYTCVGNVTNKTTATDIVDVTTTENDTMPLFTNMYFDFKPNNISWLKAGTQQSGTGIYEFTYQELVNELTTPKYSLKVVDTSKMIAGTDYTQYWKINQTNKTFTAPIVAGLISELQGNKRILVASKKATIADTTWYNLYSDGYIEQGGITPAIQESTDYTVTFLKEMADTSYNILTKTMVYETDDVLFDPTFYDTSRTTKQFILKNTRYTGSGTDTVKVSWRIEGFAAEVPEITASDNLYFKVANAVQNLELLDVGEVLEAVNNVVPNNKELITGYAMPSDKYVNLTIGANGTAYTAPANGWFQFFGAVNTGYMHFINHVNGFQSDYIRNQGSNAITGCCKIAVKKGDVVVVNYNTTITTTNFRFIYAEGEI